MSKHLPECAVDHRFCICHALRACEERVRADILQAAYESAPLQVRQDEVRRLYNLGYKVALDAAREAVEGMLLVEPMPAWDSVVRVCVEQIDALRGKA